MAKSPAFQFYTGDWLKDPNLGQCSPATRGIWIDMLALMHENGRSGLLHGTINSLSRICRCSDAEMDAALSELSDTTSANVTKRHGKVTVTNRRMSAESYERKGAA